MNKQTSKLVKTLKLIVFILFISVVVLTILAIIKTKKSTHQPTAVIANTENTALFGDIGILRAKTADETPISIVFSPYFKYPKDDTTFEEELVQKKVRIRTDLLAWFSVRTISEIKSMKEPDIKSELLKVVNNILIMGKIEQIYFEDYVILE